MSSQKTLAYMVKGGEMGGLGGGELEHPRQWLGAQRPGFSPERRVIQSCQARPEEARGPTSGTAKGGHFDHAASPAPQTACL